MYNYYLLLLLNYCRIQIYINVHKRNIFFFSGKKLNSKACCEVFFPFYKRESKVWSEISIKSPAVPSGYINAVKELTEIRARTKL